MSQSPSSDFYISFIEYCQTIPDKRQPIKRNYPLEEIMFLGLCGIISGCDGWNELFLFGDCNISFLRKYLPYINGIPSCSTISRVFSIISPNLFEDFFIDWFGSFMSKTLPKGVIISIDGKTVCNSKSASNRALHILHACASETSLLLGYKTTDKKSNEITAIPDLLDNLDIADCVVTLDAMGCQRNICKKIKSMNGDYVISLKGNQGTLNDDIRLLLNDINTKEKADSAVTTNAGHGRIETRRITTIEAGDYLQKNHHWPGLQSVAVVKSSRYNKTKKHQENEEARYYISSLPPGAAKLQYIIRKHWAVEAIHWTLDVTFNEDKIHIVMDNAAENLAFIRRVALNMMKIYQKTLSKNISLKRIQKLCMMKPDTIGDIIGAGNYLELNS